MSVPTLKPYGPFAIRDSGAPVGCGAYTTMIIFHGLQFHSATFNKLFPCAVDIKIRLVTVNRPGYPGATSLSESEYKKLDEVFKRKIPDNKLAASVVLEHLKESAQKTYDFLMQFVLEEHIPVEGGIVVVGWSIGALTILGLLAHANDFETDEHHLRSYIRHVVFYDPPYIVLGYAPPPKFCNPLNDPSLKPEEIPMEFSRWVSGYYDHGDDLSTLRCKYAEALPLPRPTILSMDPVEVQQGIEPSCMIPEKGSDAQVLVLGGTSGAFARLKDIALYVDQEQVSKSNHWNNVETKYIWCDKSAWGMVWAAICFQKELNEHTTNVTRGQVLRKIEMVRLRGANHMYHWEQPNQALKELLLL